MSAITQCQQLGGQPPDNPTDPGGTVYQDTVDPDFSTRSLLNAIHIVVNQDGIPEKYHQKMKGVLSCLCRSEPLDASDMSISKDDHR